MAPQKRLGRGLEALLSSKESSASEPTVVTADSLNAYAANPSSGLMEIPIDQIQPNRHQPRTTFDDNALDELADSIKIHGIAQPLVVTKRPEGGYELVVGERRLRASTRAGLEKVPCLVKSLSSRERFEVALIENLQRRDLNPLEESAAIDNLMKEYDLTQDQVATALGKSRSAVANVLRFLRLHEDVQASLRDGIISEGHAKVLAGISEHSEQLRFLKQIKESNMTVRRLEEFISQNGSRKKRFKGGGSKSGKSPEIRAYEDEFQRILGRRVEIQSNGNKGWIRFAFYSPWDLDNFCKKVGLLPGDPSKE